MGSESRWVVGESQVSAWNLVARGAMFILLVLGTFPMSPVESREFPLSLPNSQDGLQGHGKHSQLSKSTDDTSDFYQNLLQRLHIRQDDTPKSRVKRQFMYFMLSLLGKEGIRDYVKNTKTESFPSMMGSVGPNEILYIVSNLPPDEIMRVVTALPPDKLLEMTGRMTPAQLMELLSYVPPQGLTNLTDSFSRQQLEQFVLELPPEGIVNLTKMVPPEQAKKLMKSVSPEAMVNMTQAMTPEILMDLMTTLPPELLLDMIQSLDAENLDKMLKSFPPQVMMAMTSALPPKLLKQLFSSLPPGFIESFVSDMSQEDMGQMMSAITAEDVVKLMGAFPAEHAPNISTLLRPELISAVLDSLPKDFINNLTKLMSHRRLSRMIAAIPESDMLLMVTSVTAEQMAQVISSIKPEALTALMKAMPTDRLVALCTSLPVKTVVNMTVALAEDPGVMSGVMSAVMTRDLISAFSTAFSREFVLEIMEKLPNETIGKLAAALPVKKAFSVMRSMKSSLPAIDVNDLLKDIPKSLIAKLVTSVPPEVIANMTKQLTKNQLKQVIRLVTPEMFKLVITSVPPKAFFSIASALPEDVLSNALNAMSPRHFRNLVKAVPVEFLKSMIDGAVLNHRLKNSPDLIASAIQKMANVLGSVPPDKLTSLIKAIPRDVLVNVIDVLTPQAIAEGAAIMAGQEGFPLLVAALPLEAAAHAVSAIPPESIVKVVDAVPKATITAFAGLAEDIPVYRIQEFFGLLNVSVLKNIITKLPPRTIEKLVSSLPPETVGKMAQSFSPVTVTPFMEALRPRELRRLIRSVNTSTLSSLVQSIPQDVIVNLTEALPSDQVEKLMTAIPPVVLGQVVGYLDPAALISMMKAMPPGTIGDIMKHLPTEVIINMTRTLPPVYMQELIDLLPDAVIRDMVSIFPPDVLVDLVKIFEPEAMLRMMQKLDTPQLLSILSKLPPEAILDIVRAQTPEQTMQLLGSIPPEAMVNLTNVIPTDVMIEMMQGVPLQGLIGIMSSLPLEDLFGLASKFTPQQMSVMMERFVDDDNFIPSLMASIDLDRVVTLVDAVPLDLVTQLLSRIDVTMLKDLVQRLMPKGRKMLEEILDRGVRWLDTNSTDSFHRCLADVGIIGHGMLSFSQWAFHFMDASGKPGRGMLEGNIHMSGNYDQCKRIRHVRPGASRESDVITGSYCHVQFDIPLEHLPPIPGDGLLPMPEIAMDLCLPETCRDFEIHRLLKKIQLPLNVTIPRVSCQKDLDIRQDPAALVACGLLVVIALLVVIGTTVDCILRRRSCVSMRDNNNYRKKYCVPADTAAMAGHLSNEHTPMTGRAVPDVGIGDKLSLKEALRHSAEAESKVDDMVEMQRLVKKKGDDVINKGEGLNGRPVDAELAKSAEVAAASPCASDVGCPQPTIRHRVSVRVSGDASNDVIVDDVVGLRPEQDPKFSGEVQKRNDVGCQFVGVHMVEDIVRGVSAEDPVWLRLVTAFSVIINVRRVLSTRDSGENIGCLHGIRVLSMLWVVLANTVMFSALYFENLMSAADVLISLPSQIIINSSLSQDTFFAISGVVTAVAFFKTVSGCGRIKLRHMVYYFVHRSVRICPSYILVLVTCACLLGYMADGPHWPPPLQEQCRQQWWRNLLFINNFFVNLEDMCMSWTWFLANLMQFHYVAPIVLVPFAFGLKVVGFLMVGILTAVHIICVLVLELEINGDFMRRQKEYFMDIYQQPYCRVAPYAMGLALGFILTRRKFKFHMNKFLSLVCWALVLCVSTTLIFVTYDENRLLLVDASGWPLAARATHETLMRPLWGIIVCWVVFACSTGNGGPINKVLSWRGFLPLSRLTYCVYLIHPVIIICDLMAYRVFAYFTMAYVIFRYLGYVMLTYILALLLSVLTEFPAMGVEKIVLSAFKNS